MSVSRVLLTMFRRALRPLASATAIAAAVSISGCQTAPEDLLPRDEPLADRCVESEVVDLVLANTTTKDLGHASRMLSRTGPFGCVSERDLVELIDAVEVVDEDVRRLTLRENLDNAAAVPTQR